jgi:DNA-directed RNA polymerase specialized sigma24 family protein
MPPRRSFPYPTLFQVSFCVRRVKRADWHLASGELTSERNQAILKNYNQGYTLKQLAELFHISHQRIHQIVGQSRR